MKKGNRESRYFLMYAAVATALCLLFLLLKKDNLIVWSKTALQLRSQERKIEQLIDEGRRLDERIDALSRNRDSLEVFARETYGFCADSEDVYLLP